MQQLVKVRLRIQSLSPWDRRYLLIINIFLLVLSLIGGKMSDCSKATYIHLFFFFLWFFFFSIKIVSKVFTETFLIIAQRHQYCDILWKRLPGAVLHRDVTGERGP